MHAKYAALAIVLEGLAEKLEAGTTDLRSAMEHAGNNFTVAALDRHDMALPISQAAEMIRARAPDAFNDADEVFVNTSISRIQLLIAHTVPHVYTANGASAIPAILITIQAIQRWAESIWPMSETLEPGTMPFRLARQARIAKAKLDEVSSSLDGIEGKIDLIIEAHQTAESLPSDLADLKDARDAIQKLRDAARDNTVEIERTLETSKKAAEEAAAAATQSEGYATKSSHAYRFTTSHGLAAAFENRSRAIALSTWVWVFFLIVALGGVAYLGQSRVNALTALVAISEPKWGTVALNLVLSVVSVGAPLWFAWVATKQIAQRFRLAEDYGFKASVAKAYEGYRSEAVSLDPTFASELFGVALDRLKEAPIRLVEEGTPGSPWHELMKDSAIAEAMRTIPNAAARFSQFAAETISQIKNSKQTNSAPESAKASE